MSWHTQAELNLGSLEERGHFWHTNIQAGTHPDTGYSFIIPNKSRQDGTYLVGLPGTGKSSCSENMAVQEIHAGHSVFYIDPHGDSVDHIIAQIPLWLMDKIHLLNLADINYPFGLNLLKMDSNDPLTRTRICDRLLHCFSVLWGDITGQIYLPLHLTNACLALLDNPGSTLLDMERFLKDLNYRHLCLHNVQDPSVHQHWRWVESLSRSEQEKQLMPIQHRLGLLFSGRPIVRNIIGQAQTTVDFRKATENHETILIKMPMQTLPNDARIIATLLIAAIHEAVFSYGDVPEHERPGFSLYVDEVQSVTSPDFAIMLTQARKYGARITIANQYVSQLPTFLQDAIKGVGTKVCFRLNHDDARLMAPYFVTGETKVDVGSIETKAVDWLIQHGSDNPNVRQFIAWYLLPLQSHKYGGRVEIKRPGIQPEHAAFHLLNQEPPQEKPKEADPTPYINALLYEVMKSGYPDMQIPSEILLGLANCGRGFYQQVRFSFKLGKLLRPGYAYPTHLVNGGVWNRLPEDSHEQLLHCVFHLRETMAYLAASPIGMRTQVDANEIASMLTQLPKRAAFVRSGDDVGVIFTDDTLPACDEEEFEARLTQVRVQTIQKYCRQLPQEQAVNRPTTQPTKPQFRRFTEVI